MVALAVCDVRPDGSTVVNVFALGIFKLADLALVIKLFHFIGHRHIAIVFAVSIDLARLLDRLDELDRLLHRLNGEHLGIHVLSCLHSTDSEGRVLRRVVCEDDRVHIVVYKLVKIVVKCDVIALTALFLLGEHIGVIVADGNDLGVVRDLAIVYHSGAAVTAHNTDLDFCHTKTSFFLHFKMERVKCKWIFSI